LHFAFAARDADTLGGEWTRPWERLCGARAVNRMVNTLLIGDDAFLRAMLDGWMPCEGHARRKTRRAAQRVGITISRMLAFRHGIGRESHFRA
jgi:hypothetical protein